MFGYPYMNMMPPNGSSVRDLFLFEEWLEEREKKKKERDTHKKDHFPKMSTLQWVIILFALGPWVGAAQWTMIKHVFGW